MLLAERWTLRQLWNVNSQVPQAHYENRLRDVTYTVWLSNTGYKDLYGIENNLSNTVIMCRNFQ